MNRIKLQGYNRAWEWAFWAVVVAAVATVLR